MKSIRSRINVTLIWGTGILLVLAGFLLQGAIERRLATWFDGAILERAQTLITLTKEYEEGFELDFADEFMPEFSSPEGPEYFELWLPDGTLMERSHSLGERPMTETWHRVKLPEYKNALIGGGLCRMLTVSFIPQNENLDMEGVLDISKHPDKVVTLLMARKRQPFDRLLATLRITMASAFLSLLVTLLFLVRRTLISGMSPLEEIRRQVARLDPNRLDSTIEMTGCPRELTPIVDQINSLLERLRLVIARERQFTSDISHELRTPIAELRSLCEVILTYKKDATERPFFKDVHDIARSMEQMVANLLALARFDNGTQIVRVETVDLHNLVLRTWMRTAALAEERNITLENHVPLDTEISTDALMMEQILQNLVNNAVCLAPLGSHVRVAFSLEGAVKKVAIINPAPNLEARDMPHLFDRFWRGDGARTTGQNSGLGLALVQAFAELLSQKVEAALKGENLEISLFFPDNASA